MRLWIGLSLPLLPLEVFCPNWSADQGSVVLEHERVLALSAAARAVGVQAGLRRGGVLMLLPEARLHERSADALWAAEQVLRSGSCGALLFWPGHARGETLRRLHLAAQSGETLFFMLRPLAAAQDSSPAPLRLSLRPAAGGIEIGVVKRRGPQRDAPLFLPLTPSLLQRHATLDRALPAPAPARSVQPELVG